MYSVLIVDDEQIIRNSILSMLHRMNDDRIGEISVSACAEDALEFCQDHKPDIVITDIVMGDKNGIELLSELNARLSGAHYLVISGYDSYQYIRSAFQEGAVDYLLKPLLYPELEKAIREICNQLDQDRLTALNSSFQQYILSLQQGDSVSASAYFPEYLPSQSFFIALLAYPSRDEAVMDQLFSEPSLMNLTQYKATFFRSGSLVYLMLHDSPCIQDRKSFVMTQILRFSRAELLPAVAADQCPLQDLSSGFNRLRRCIAFCLRNNYGNVYLPAPEDDDASLLLRNFSDIRHYLSCCRSDNLEATLQALSDLFRQTRPCDLSSTYQYFTNVVNQMTIQQDYTLQASFFPSFHSFLDEAELLGAVRNIVREILVRQRTKYPDYITQIKNYIEAHYGQKLSLSDVAEHFSISYAHLSHVFSSTMNLSFTEYLTLVRMQHAQQMICEPNYTIQEISYMCGYENQFSFTRAFKKYYGISPTGYRKALGTAFNE